MAERVIHTIEPIWDINSKVLILGTMPSQKSREMSFYYAHPQNRFWSVMSELFTMQAETREQRIELLHKNGIALWDVIQSCEIVGSSDSSIKNVVPNDLNPLIENSQIKAIFTTGATAFKLYNRYCRKETGIDAVCLPSTSPANAKWSLQSLIKEYKTVACELS